MKLKRMGLILIVFLAMTACEPESPGGGGITEGTYLYMTDTYNGNVYLYDIENENAVSSPLLSVGTASSGEIYFYEDIGYIVVGNNYSNNPGIYYFDPRAAVPEATRIGDAISAQAAAFYSDTKAYVIDGDYGVSAGVYAFNPQNPEAGLTGPIAGTILEGGNGRYLQDIVIGNDGNVYVSDYNTNGGNGNIIVINPATDSVSATVAVNSDSTTGLEAVTIASTDYIICSGNSFTAPTVDWLECGTSNVTTLCSLAAGAGFIDYDPASSMLYASGYTNTYSIDLSGAGPYTAVEILDGGVSFGGSDVEVDSGLVYISNYGYDPLDHESKLYIITAATGAQASSSPLSVMDAADGIAGLAVYEY